MSVASVTATAVTTEAAVATPVTAAAAAVSYLVKLHTSDGYSIDHTYRLVFRSIKDYRYWCQSDSGLISC